MVDAVQAGRGVIDYPGIYPIASGTVMANISGSTALPVAVTLADLAAYMGTPSYQGTWNASTNSPVLASSVGTNGFYYVVSVAGTTNLNGITDWSVGDWAIYNGTVAAWQKIEGGATTITNGTTAISGGTNTRVLFDDSGVIGESAGLTYVKATGLLAATVMALGGATIGSNVFSGVGTAALAGATTTGPDWEVWINGDTFARAAVGVNTTDVARFSMGPGNAARDLFLERAGAANLRLGGPAVDTAPIAQTVSMQNTLAGGTSNVAGANFTLAMSQGKGTGVGGSFIVQVAPAGSTGTAVNALATALTIDSAKAATFAGVALVSDGTASAPGLGFSSNTGTGLYQFSAASLAVTSSGTVRMILTDNSNFTTFRTFQTLAWDVNNLGGAISRDTSISRIASGIIGIGTGAAGSTAGQLMAKTVLGVSLTVATLPAAASNQGAIAFVTDATTTAVLGLGNAVVGGGTNKVPVYSDGTNWIIL